MLAPFFVFKLIRLLTFLRIVATGAVRVFLILILFAVELALRLFLFVASIMPQPPAIANARRIVASIDPFEPLKQDTGPIGIVARLLLP